MPINARQFFYPQIIGALVIVALVTVLGPDQRTIISAALGVGIALGAALVFFVIVQRFGRESPKRIVAGFYLAEVAKMLLVVIAFAATFSWFSVNAFVLMLSFFAIYVLHWCALVFLRKET